MPCGGIYPIKGTWVMLHTGYDILCFHCNQSGCTLWVEEWDAPLHIGCLDAFLETPEGQIIIAHGHEIQRE